MKTPLVAAAVVVSLMLVTSVVAPQPEPKSAGGPPPPPPIRAIPGLTAPDPHPNGCVDCHVFMKDANLDVRISTLMKQWQAGAEPKLVAAAKCSAADSTRIKGRHPQLTGSRKDIPGSCLVCHGRSSTMAPPFARMLHEIHLVGGAGNHFITDFQGDCTHCHKLDATTGAWKIPSAPEPAGD